MSALSTSRRTHSKSYPITLKNFQYPKDSIISSSPSNLLTLRPKNLSGAPSYYLPIPSDVPFYSRDTLAERVSTQGSVKSQVPNIKKLMKPNCMNVFGGQSTARNPLKSPPVFKLLHSTPREQSKPTVRTYTLQGTSSLAEEDLLAKTLRAPTFSKNNMIKKRGTTKNSESLVGSNNTSSNQGSMSTTRIMDSSATVASVKAFELTSVIPSSSSEQHSIDNPETKENVRKSDKAEDLNRRLRNIFKGAKLDQSCISELETSIAEEGSDLRLKVFKTKTLFGQFKSKPIRNNKRV